MREPKPFVVKPGRIACCVPFCRRTFKIEPGDREIMCGAHYRLGDARLRRLRAKVIRKLKSGRLSWDFGAAMAERLWIKIKEQAMTRG